MTFIPTDADLARAMRVRELINESLRNRTPQERDRLLQIHLAQARGPKLNAWLLRQSTNAMLTIRRAHQKREASA